MNIRHCHWYFFKGAGYLSLRRTFSQSGKAATANSEPLNSENFQQSPKSRLTVSFQNAALATAVIRQIKYAQPPQNIGDPSLREQVLKVSPSIEGHTFDESVRADFLKLFKEGVFLDKKVYSQSSVTMATQKFPRSNDYGGDSKSIQQPFVFCPNFMVTRAMFNLMTVQPYITDILIYGGYGISKTISIILLCHLSSIIHKFLYEASLNRPNNQQKEELERFKGHIEAAFPRFWYWSIDYGKVVAEDFSLSNIIIRQAKELPQSTLDQLQKIKSFSTLSAAIKKNYMQDTQHFVVVDQFNELASAARQYKDAVISNYQDRLKQEKEIRKQADKKMKQDRQQLLSRKILAYKRQQFILLSNYKKILQLIQECKYLSRKFILNSSQNIEKDLFDDISWKRNPQIFNKLSKISFRLLSGHMEVVKYQVLYSQKLKEPWAQIDFLHFFWFEILRLLMPEKDDAKQFRIFNESELNNIRDGFYEAVQEIEIKSYFQPIFISRFLAKNIEVIKEIKSKNKNMSMEEIKTALKKTVEQFSQFCVEQSRKNLTLFIQKPNEGSQRKGRKICLITLLNAIALDKFANNKENQRIIIKETALNNIFPFDQKDKQSISQILKSYNNNQLIPVEIKDGYIHFDWTAKECMEIAGPIVAPALYKQYSQLSSEQMRQKLQKNPSALGIILEDSIRKLLLPGMTVIVAQLSKDWIEKKYQIKAASTFVHFLGGEPSIEVKMKQMLDAAKGNPGSFIVGTPVKSQKDQSWSCQNPVFDFAFVQYAKGKGKFDQQFFIDTYDVTIGKNFSDKVTKAGLFFQKLISSLSDRAEFIIQHHILCYQQYISPSISTEVSEETSKGKAQILELKEANQLKENVQFKIKFAYLDYVGFKGIEIKQNYAADVINFKILLELGKKIEQFQKKNK